MVEKDGRTGFESSDEVDVRRPKVLPKPRTSTTKEVDEHKTEVDEHNVTRLPCSHGFPPLRCREELTFSVQDGQG